MFEHAIASLQDSVLDDADLPGTSRLTNQPCGTLSNMLVEDNRSPTMETTHTPHQPLTPPLTTG